MDAAQDIPTSTSTPPPSERLSNQTLQDNGGNDISNTARDWQRKLIVQGKELDRLTQLNEFLELERRLRQ